MCGRAYYKEHDGVEYKVYCQGFHAYCDKPAKGFKMADE